MTNFEINFCGLNFENPLVLASGILGVSAENMNEVIQNGAGGVTTKSIWLENHKGHPNPVIIATDEMVMNAVGLSDAGIEKAREEIKSFKKISKAPIIASIVGAKVADFALIAQEISNTEADMVEVNISCPNVEDELGRPFACDIQTASKVTKTVKQNTDKKVAIKLSPNVPNIGDIAKACEEAGADAITAINTVGPGMRINIELRKPILANKVGGISGPAVFPIAVRAVHEIYKKVSIPIIGTGGVNTGEEAIELMIAGANLVGIGSGVHFRGVDVFAKINQEMDTWCEKNNIKNLKDIIGTLEY